MAGFYRADPQCLRRKLIPVRVEDCERPDLLGEVVSSDLFGLAAADARQHLLDTIGHALAGRAKPEVPPAFPAQTSPSTSLAAEPAFPGPTARQSDELSTPSRHRDIGWFHQRRPMRGAWRWEKVLLVAAPSLALLTTAAISIASIWPDGGQETPPVESSAPFVSPGAGETQSGAASVPGVTDPADACRTGETSYHVESGESSVDIVVRHGSFVTQKFVAASPCITWAGVIFGCNPGILGLIGSSRTCLDGNGSFGQILLEIIDDERTLASVRVETANNAVAGGYLTPAATGLIPGGRYLLRVVNLTGVPAGFYFKAGDDLTLSTEIIGAFHSYQDGLNPLNLSAIINNQA